LSLLKDFTTRHRQVFAPGTSSALTRIARGRETKTETAPRKTLLGRQLRGEGDHWQVYAPDTNKRPIEHKAKKPRAKRKRKQLREKTL
jgi:hypothetical protein